MSKINCLPEEILGEILSRLPIKTLVLCACTSKWLLSFISSPSFMVTQMKKNNHNPFFFLRYYTESTQKEYFSLQPDDDSFTGEFNLIDMPIRCSDVTENCWLKIVGSCNGLICLSDDPLECPNPNNIILWNPSVRKRIKIPIPETTYNGCNFCGFSTSLGLGFDCLKNEFKGGICVALGFGFDSLRNDFKVVRLVYRQCSCTNEFKDPPFVDVYSLNSKSWSIIEALGPVYQVCNPEYSECFVNGAVHWPGWRGSIWSVIVAFNVEDEVFREIKMPDCLVKGELAFSSRLKVGKCRDMLGLIKLSSGGNDCSVWVMREYGVMDSWSKIFCVDLPDGYLKPRVFGFRKNEETLVFVGDESFHECRHLMLLADRNGCVIKILGMIDGKPCSFCLDTYVESLALLTEGTEILECN